MLGLVLFSLLAVGNPPARPVVAVMYLDNQTGKPEYDGLKKGLAELVVADLAGFDGVSVVERARLDETIQELKPPRGKTVEGSTPAKLGKLLAANWLVTGTASLDKGKLVLEAQVHALDKPPAAPVAPLPDGGVAPPATDVVAAARVSGEPAAVSDLEQELVQKLTEALDLKPKDPALRNRARVPDLDALLVFAKALDQLDEGKLKEAQTTLNVLLSANPGFVLAREKKGELLKRLDELDKQRKEQVTDAVVKLGKVADEWIGLDERFDTLDDKAQLKVMAFRAMKGRVLLRVLKQYLSRRRDSPRVVLKNRQGEAWAVMRTWVDNERRLGEEEDRYIRFHSKVVNGIPVAINWSPQLGPELEELMHDAAIGTLSLGPSSLAGRISFELMGLCVDGETSYTVAPALGDVDPREQKVLFELIDQKVNRLIQEYAGASPVTKPLVERQAIDLLRNKAEALLRLDRDDDAVATYQRVLDAFPITQQAGWYQSQIKQVVAGSHSDRERWAKAMKSCDEMDIRVGDAALQGQTLRQGWAAMELHAAELDRSCKPAKPALGAFAFVYAHLASEGAAEDDCDAFRKWNRKYLEVGGSIHEMLVRQKQGASWCELGDVVKQAVWFYATVDDANPPAANAPAPTPPVATLELDRNLTSVRSHDGKVLSLHAFSQSSPENLSLYLDATGPGTFKCRTAQWERRDKSKVDGPCEVTVTHLAENEGDHDEGTFVAQFELKEEDAIRKMAMTEGHFRLRRE